MKAAVSTAPSANSTIHGRLQNRSAMSRKGLGRGCVASEKRSRVLRNTMIRQPTAATP